MEYDREHHENTIALRRDVCRAMHRARLEGRPVTAWFLDNIASLLLAMERQYRLLREQQTSRGAE